MTKLIGLFLLASSLALAAADSVYRRGPKKSRAEQLLRQRGNIITTTQRNYVAPRPPPPHFVKPGDLEEQIKKSNESILSETITIDGVQVAKTNLVIFTGQIISVVPSKGVILSVERVNEYAFIPAAWYDQTLFTGFLKILCPYFRADKLITRRCSPNACHRRSDGNHRPQFLYVPEGLTPCFRSSNFSNSGTPTVFCSSTVRDL
jgi:hypothetical protein